MKIPTPAGWSVYRDERTKVWWGYRLDAEGNQVGPAEHAARKSDLVAYINWMGHQQEAVVNPQGPAVDYLEAERGATR